MDLNEYLNIYSYTCSTILSCIHADSNTNNKISEKLSMSFICAQYF